jgi:hypothetical protein
MKRIGGVIKKMPPMIDHHQKGGGAPQIVQRIEMFQLGSHSENTMIFPIISSPPYLGKTK